MPDETFTLAAAIRLGTLSPVHANLQCDCGTLLKQRPYHLLECPKLRNTVATFRHNLITQVLMTFLRRCGAAVWLEPRLSTKDDRRPDLFAALGTNLFLLDVTVRNPMAPSHVTSGQTSRLVATQAEQEKHAKYDKLARERGARLVPFATETMGAFGKEAETFVHKMADHAAASGASVSRAELLYGVVSAVQVAVQRGNALMIQMGSQALAQSARRSLVIQASA
jgi:hypothetical protein